MWLFFNRLTALIYRSLDRCDHYKLSKKKTKQIYFCITWVQITCQLGIIQGWVNLQIIYSMSTNQDMKWISSVITHLRSSHELSDLKYCPRLQRRLYECCVCHLLVSLVAPLNAKAISFQDPAEKARELDLYSDRNILSSKQASHHQPVTEAHIYHQHW